MISRSVDDHVNDNSVLIARVVCYFTLLASVYLHRMYIFCLNVLKN